MKLVHAVAAAAVASACTAATAQVKWDMPTPYPATNFHTENIVKFAADIEGVTKGQIKIQVHPGASLFKAPEIKRAVQGGQAQIGEILISGALKSDAPGCTWILICPLVTPSTSAANFMMFSVWKLVAG